MGLTRQYLRYVACGSPFGVIGSPNGHLVFLPLNGVRDKYVAASTCENVTIWDTKANERVKFLAGEKSEVTALAVEVTNRLIATGYADGSIRVFDFETEQMKITLVGHKTAISCLSFDEFGMRLASGGKDTEVVVWDVVSESGLFRLKGHKNVVTKCMFIKKHSNILITSSRDTFVKFWDLETQHCFKTLVGHRSEVWDFVLLAGNNRLITGAGDSELRVWGINYDNLESKSVDNEVKSLPEVKSISDADPDVDAGEDDDEASPLSVKKLGSILRKSTTRVQSLHLDSSEQFIVCNGNDNLVEVFKLRKEEEIKDVLQKRSRKERKKLKRLHPESEQEIEYSAERTLSDEIERLEPFKASAKIKACDVLLKENTCKISALLVNNAIEMFASDSPKTFTTTGAIKLEGHRTDVRTVAFSSDNFFILSASAESVKVWSRSSKKCIATAAEGCGYALCSLFAPGDKYCVIGTKQGHLQIMDIASAQLLETVVASEESQPIWSMDMFPNRKGIVTGSEDKLLKFWDFEFTNNEDKVKRLTLVHKRTLKMDEGILCVKITPNSNLVAVSLLDSTVKIFFMDSLKFFLNLYGHKFPVLCMDISSDSTLIATGSSDKNIKLWGLDFGDCHKSMFAHDESVTGLQFVPKTHHLFSCGKDKLVKEWDADNYEKIITLEGHQNEVWALAVSPNGKYVVSASHDKTLRLWEKTDEPLVLEEEQEMEREDQFEKSAFAGDESVVPGESNLETGLPSKKTTETVKATELLIEAVDLFKDERAVQRDYQLKLDSANERKANAPQIPAPNPLMAKFSTTCPHRFVLETIRRIKSSELEEALLCLPFNYVSDLLRILSELLEKGWEVELTCRCIGFLTRIHLGQITSSAPLLPIVDKLKTLTIEKVLNLKDMVGFNLAGLRNLQEKLNEKEDVTLFSEAFSRHKEKKRGKKAKHNKTSVAVFKLS